MPKVESYWLPVEQLIYIPRPQGSHPLYQIFSLVRANKMKFTYSLQYNTVPEWTEDYLHYSDLKRSLHEIETTRLEESKGLSPAAGTNPSNATSINLGPQSERMESEFCAAFEADAKRVSAAFMTKKEACYSKLRELFAAVTSDSSSDVAVNRIQVWSADDAGLEKRRATLEDSFNTVYLNLHDLHDFLDLNYTGYVKLVKAYSQYVAASAEKKRALLAKVDSILPIAELSQLQASMGQVEEAYGRVMCEGSVTQARAALHLLLRDRVAASRQSESPVNNDGSIMKTAPILPAPATAEAANKAAPKKASYFTMSRILSIIGCIAIFTVLMLIPNTLLGEVTATFERKACLAILITSTALWCTEALPLYVTAMLVPALVAITQCIPMSADHVGADHVAKKIFGLMFTDMIFLLIGGFSMAAALQKYGITRAVAVFFLQRFGKTSSSVLLTIMTITVLASSLVSNVTAPVLSFSLIQPILLGLDAESKLARALILGIAFAANIGGLTSSIASPQSVFAASDKEYSVGFATWFIFSVPIAFVSTVFCWLWLRYTYPSKERLNFKEIFAAKAGDRSATAGQMIYVCAVSAITLALWIFNSEIKSYVGPMGVVGVFPIVALFGAGMLGKDDFNGFMWNVVFLALGGSALGKALEQSQLLSAIGEVMKTGMKGASFFTALCFFVGVLLFITTFVSHSVGAMVFLPIIKAFGESAFVGERAKIAGLMLAAGFTCSAGMAMPISGFPNMTAAALQDRNKINYVNTSDFVKGGVVPSIVIAASIIVTFYFLSPLILKA